MPDFNGAGEQTYITNEGRRCIHASPVSHSTTAVPTVPSLMWRGSNPALETHAPRQTQKDRGARTASHASYLDAGFGLEPGVTTDLALPGLVDGFGDPFPDVLAHPDLYTAISESDI